MGDVVARCLSREFRPAGPVPEPGQRVGYRKINREGGKPTIAYSLVQRVHFQDNAFMLDVEGEQDPVFSDAVTSITETPTRPGIGAGTEYHILVQYDDGTAQRKIAVVVAQAGLGQNPEVYLRQGREVFAASAVNLMAPGILTSKGASPSHYSAAI